MDTLEASSTATTEQNTAIQEVIKAIEKLDNISCRTLIKKEVFAQKDATDIPQEGSENYDLYLAKQNFLDPSKISNRAQLRDLIKTQLNLFYQHESLKLNGNLRESLNPEGTFAKYLLDSTPNDPYNDSTKSKLAQIFTAMHSICEALYQISLSNNQDRRELFFIEYPPIDLACVEGTSARIDEILTTCSIQWSHRNC